MKIESIRLKNFRALRDVHLENLPSFCVLVGANGTGKSTLFSVFAFLRDAMTSNVTAALAKLGGSRGFHEVRSRNATGPIEIELKIRAELGGGKPKLVSYEVVIDEDGGRPVVAREVLKYRRGSSGKPWHFIDFSRGTGTAVTNELEAVTDESELLREPQTLKSPDFSPSRAWRSSSGSPRQSPSVTLSRTGTSPTSTSAGRGRSKRRGTPSTSRARGRTCRS